MDVYEKLAKKLDELPQGFPSTDTGVELKILRMIFSPEEAEMALLMTPAPETAEQVAARISQPAEETRAMLDQMAKKGQIASLKTGGHQVYRFIPFVIGIYESQRNERMTKELAELFEEYGPYLARKAGGHAPHQARVIPVNAAIPTDLQVLMHDDIRQILNTAKSFRVQDCICRKEKKLMGDPCKHTIHNCIHYSMEENAYDYFNPEGEIITREEAFRILEQNEKEGLIHTTYNVVNVPGGFLCSCCSCSCAMIRAIHEYKAPYMIAKSNYVADIDLDACIACGICRDERCSMSAIVEEDGEYRVVQDRCIGCGVCVITCPSKALTMIERPVEDRDAIANDMMDWAKKRMVHRLQDEKEEKGIASE